MCEKSFFPCVYNKHSDGTSLFEFKTTEVSIGLSKSEQSAQYPHAYHIYTTYYVVVAAN